MSSPFLQPPTQSSPSIAFDFSRKAPILLKSGSTTLPIPFANTDSAETWTLYEHLLLSCLQTGDDDSAQACLEKLTARFGSTNERVMGLQGLYKEAIAEDDASLERILKEYEEILKEDPTNMPIAKRRIALLRTLSKPANAISALVQLLDASPTDIEAWSELSDLYLSQGQFSQAVFSLEEVLLSVPNAWNIHAAMGEILYAWAMSMKSAGDGVYEKTLAEAMQRFCRSIELCDNYLRGYYGLKLVTMQLLAIETSVRSKAESGQVPFPTEETVRKLDARATSKLAEIVRRKTQGEEGWSGYEAAEIRAAHDLLDAETRKIER